MRLSEYAAFDACGLAELVCAGQVRSDELARLAFEACAKVNPQLNAVIEFYEDAETVAGADGGIFQGVPFLRKDLGATEAGRLQECGSRLFQGRRAEIDSNFFQLARRAGLRTVGRTATPELGTAGVTESILVGITRNPWDVNVSAGGSSGGAAAAVASGIVPMAHGGDGGGSIRTPACFTGLIGLNPSRGRVSGGPNKQDSNLGLARQFVLCRSVRDMAAALDVFSAPAAGDPFTIVQPARPYREELTMASRAATIGVALTNWGEAEIEPDVKEAVAATARQLEAMGHIVEEMPPPCPAHDYVEILLGVKHMFSGGLAKQAKALGRAISADTLEPVNLKLYEESLSVPLSHAETTIELIRKMRTDVAIATAAYDFLLTPCMPMVSLPHGRYATTNEAYSARSWMEMDAAIYMFLGVFNVTGQPSVSLPVWTSGTNMPIGVQVVGKFGDESGLVRMARDLECAMPWAGRPAPVHAGR